MSQAVNERGTKCAAPIDSIREEITLRSPLIAAIITTLYSESLARNGFVKAFRGATPDGWYRTDDLPAVLLFTDATDGTRNGALTPGMGVADPFGAMIRAASADGHGHDGLRLFIAALGAAADAR